MKTKFNSFLIICSLFSVLLVLICSCEKEKKEEKFSIPVVSTHRVDIISQNKAMGVGEIIDDGGETAFVVGVCWSKTQNPTLDDNKSENGDIGEIFSFNIQTLEPNTTYYVRAYATNSEGTGYGEELSFSTMESVTDVEGNIYQTVLIGSQEWMAENLKTTKYKDGSAIIYPGSDDNAWWDNIEGAYAWFGNNIDFKDSYGALYNWHAVDNSKGLCPAGWRVPDNEDWEIMKDYLSTEYEVLLAKYFPLFPYAELANALKSCRQISSPLGGECNTVAHPRWFPDHQHYGLDLFGFSALPGGGRHQSGSYRWYEIGAVGGWWTSTYSSSDKAFYRKLIYNLDTRFLNSFSDSRAMGWSVRCIRDSYEQDMQ